MVDAQNILPGYMVEENMIAKFKKHLCRHKNKQGMGNMDHLQADVISLYRDHG